MTPFFWISTFLICFSVVDLWILTLTFYVQKETINNATELGLRSPSQDGRENGKIRPASFMLSASSINEGKYQDVSAMTDRQVVATTRGSPIKQTTPSERQRKISNNGAASLDYQRSNLPFKFYLSIFHHFFIMSKYLHFLTSSESVVFQCKWSETVYFSRACPTRKV